MNPTALIEVLGFFSPLVNTRLLRSSIFIIGFRSSVTPIPSQNHVLFISQKRNLFVLGLAAGGGRVLKLARLLRFLFVL